MHVIHLRRCVEDMLPRTMPRVARRSATLRRAQLQRLDECQKPWFDGVLLHQERTQSVRLSAEMSFRNAIRVPQNV